MVFGVHTLWQIDHNSQVEIFLAARKRQRFSSTIPFAEPETALPAMIGVEGELNPIRGKITRPEARAGPSTTFQSLTRRLNNLRVFALFCLVILSNANLCTRRRHPCWRRVHRSFGPKKRGPQDDSGRNGCPACTATVLHRNSSSHSVFPPLAAG